MLLVFWFSTFLYALDAPGLAAITLVLIMEHRQYTNTNFSSDTTHRSSGMGIRYQCKYSLLTPRVAGLEMVRFQR